MGQSMKNLRETPCILRKLEQIEGKFVMQQKNIYLVTLVLQLLGQTKEEPQQKGLSLKY